MVKLEVALEKNKKRTTKFVCGDFNVDLLQKSNKRVKVLIDVMEFFTYGQCVYYHSVFAKNKPMLLSDSQIIGEKD